MSSPISSLKKGKRTPLDPRQAQVPFRNLEHTSVELPSGSLKKDGFSKVPKSSSSTNAPSDRDLLSSMMSRLAQVEQQLKAAQTQIGEKDKKIRILEEKAKLLEKARGYNSGTITELEKKCRRLQTQVFQMEEFLADYGMVWVGDDASDSDYEVLEEPSSTAAPSSISRQGVWNPNSSLVNSAPRDFQMDFDVVTKNIRELNVLAGEGCSDVSRTKDGARLKVRESVPLVLYSNGILMFGGPFRPYSDPITQQCLQDIMDGYFPSELQSRYPGGVPFEVQDKRDIVFEDRRTALLFPGTGQSLAAEENAKSLKVESHTPGLSPLYIYRGVETARPQSAGKTQVSTLRIKSETGEMTYILKMKFTDCIRDVRSHVDAARPKDAPPYDIKTSFPNRVYDDPNATLQECGLVPNATLHLLVKKV
ncbi:UBX domain-containing protein 11-like [Stylophora pistillata]|uniref:UBX domain-containing protein 11-like n=1 Tax=Stylophora pistillata TaxID=50429 RepID=UPI000C05235D|nr:UBX domain-containing protein 11-like [Stylophora pistillata]